MKMTDELQPVLDKIGEGSGSWEFYQLVASDIRKLATYHLRTWSGKKNAPNEDDIDELVLAVAEELSNPSCVVELRKAWKSESNQSSAYSFSEKFLKKIVGRVAKRRFRDLSKQPHSLGELADEPVSPQVKPQSSSKVSMRVRATLSKLKSGDQDLLLMRYDKEMSVAEIAEILAIDYSTAATKIWRATNRFKKEYEKENAPSNL
jgi:RNA polymerase sigma factor (sigma-70 family)